MNTSTNKAKVRYVEKEVTRTERVADGVTLDLNEEEAVKLRAVLGRVAVSDGLHAVYTALRDVERCSSLRYRVVGETIRIRAV
ncbi:UNVERIFIED_ORG: hypothetical protein ABIC48_002030 [Burkholderia territorii]